MKILESFLKNNPETKLVFRSILCKNNKMYRVYMGKHEENYFCVNERIVHGDNLYDINLIKAKDLKDTVCRAYYSKYHTERSISNFETLIANDEKFDTIENLREDLKEGHLECFLHSTHQGIHIYKCYVNSYEVVLEVSDEYCDNIFYPKMTSTTLINIKNCKLTTV